ncbi:hypothetical protein NDU88_002621 [Pleurodeles waltl]|uniref:Uncharacterized protein n=1 Tax=Pleurodeles waltl TaxID=8319 RepID=A0AAV7WQQ3_PLEWA|nr:hypothetical protein NDU88_002621 [Pleurodeles waltl]
MSQESQSIRVSARQASIRRPTSWRANPTGGGTAPTRPRRAGVQMFQAGSNREAPHTRADHQFPSVAARAQVPQGVRHSPRGLRTRDDPAVTA